MGKPGKIDEADVQHQIETVRTACLKRQMALGIFGVDAAAVKPYLKQGYMLIVAGMDTLLVDQSVQRLLSALKP